MYKLTRSGCGVLSVVACALMALPALADSQARIVRLSDVQGSVQIDKNTGLGFENAFLNLPITQGTQVKTRDRGRAEIEFEDGSTLRLTPNTTVEFSTLGLSDSGKRISVINLVEGMAYVNWLGKSGDEFSLNFSREKISLDHAAHFRVDTSPQVSDLAVFKGNVDVDGSAGKVVVEKKKTATFVADNDKYTLANNVEESPLDSWDKQASSYHDQYAKNNSSPYGYGVSDLNYYGAYSNVPGFGMMWQPFFAGVGWNPFMDGAWSFYPGYGFMFASAYPWGWMPFHYGNWMFAPGFGWMWQPGGFNTWSTVPRYAGTLPANFHPPVAPAAGTVKTVVVGRAGTGSSFPTSRLVVNAGSAGMGIPRGSLGNLHQLNQQVAKTGLATVRPAPQFAANAPRPSSPAYTSSSSHSTMSAPSMSHSSGSSGHSSTGSHH
ncbi:MAG: FecR family protein [Candidatus Sulfotelmatobacter sp.]